MQIKDGCYYRINDLIPKDPRKPKIIPMSRSSWFAGVKHGKYPQPQKFGPRISAWKGEDIRRLLENGAE